MRFKVGQRVRIKGTDIKGTYNEVSFIDRNLGHVKADRFERILVVPHELLEPVAGPITVTFDPVKLPLTAHGVLGTPVSISIDSVGSVNLNTPEYSGRSLSRQEARKLAFAILTITEAQDA